MTRFFNTSGPVVAEDHYQIPPLTRLDIAEFRQLVARKRYFVREVILSQMARQARRTGDEYLSEAWAAIFAEHGVDALAEALSRWAEAADKAAGAAH